MRTIVTMALLTLALAARPATALTVVVPTDYPTIAAALASGADEILVADGDHSGGFTINRPVMLRARPSSGYAVWSSAPVILGNVTFANGSTGGLARLQGFHVLGDVLVQTAFASSELQVLITESRISGRVHRGTFAGQNGAVGMRGCIVGSGIDLNPYAAQFAFVTVLDGGLTSNFEGDISIMHNHVQGAGLLAAGIRVPNADVGGRAQDNTVDGVQDGLTIGSPSGFVAQYNIIRGCSQDGIVVTGGGTSSVLSNTVQNVGRHGINTDGIHTVGGNVVQHPAQNGIRTTGTAQVINNAISDVGTDGVNAIGGGAIIRQNSILRAGGIGIVASDVSAVDRNVTGRCASDGVRTTGSLSTSITGNTSYLNGGHGYRNLVTASTAIDNNIAHGNSLFGLFRSGGASTMSCNDWFGNSAGTTSGVAPGATDVFVNPLFCNLPVDDVSLSSASPLVGTACGQIGARGVGCAVATGVEDAPAATEPSLELGPNPSRGDVRFTWRLTPGAVELEVYDLRGAKVWSRRFDAGERTHVWNGRDDRNRALPPGVYLSRLRANGLVEQQRLVRVH